MEKHNSGNFIEKINNLTFLASLVTADLFSDKIQFKSSIEKRESKSQLLERETTDS
jgi:hypothetical protein